MAVFEYGSDGVRNRNFEVYIKKTEDDAYDKIGVCLAEGIGTTIEEGESVETNSEGNIHLDKQGSATFTLVNVTPDNITYFENLDKTPIDVVFVDARPFETGGTDEKWVTQISNVQYNYTEEIMSGSAQTLPVTLSKTISTPSEFRTISYMNEDDFGTLIDPTQV